MYDAMIFLGAGFKLSEGFSYHCGYDCFKCTHMSKLLLPLKRKARDELCTEPSTSGGCVIKYLFHDQHVVYNQIQVFYHRRIKNRNRTAQSIYQEAQNMQEGLCSPFLEGCCIQAK